MAAKVYSTSISVSAYFDHRQFLEAVVEDLRAQGVYSHRTFNRECGFASPNFVQLVIQGKRNLSEDGALKVAATLGLSRSDTKLFLLMRAMNIAPDPTERLEKFQQLLSQPAFAAQHELAADELRFYSRWWNIVIRELLQSHPDASTDAISAALVPRVSVADVEESLRLMRTLGFLGPDGRVVHRQLNTRNEIMSQAIVSFHVEMLNLAREALQRFTVEEREVSSLTLQLTEKEFLELREHIREFKRDALAREKVSADSQVYQFNFQLFPVSKRLT